MESLTCPADSYYFRGSAYGRKGEIDRAVKDYTEAIRLKPDDEPAFFARGLAYENKGDQAKADPDFAQSDALKAKK